MAKMKKFFQFFNQEYYALISVVVDVYASGEHAMDKATDVYVESVAGDSVSEVLHEGLPREVSQFYAFWEFCNCEENRDTKAGELITEFTHSEDRCIVIDGALI